MNRNEVKVNNVDGQTIILVAPAETRIPRVAYLTLASHYAPEGHKAVMAEGGTGFMDWNGERRMVHEFWTERVAADVEED
jgi:hypothetical protein